ncbi:MAG: glutathione S-transferase [Thalassolituus sp.]
MAEANGLILYTINMSHYSEKIRWLLDYEGINYQEEALTPAVHTLPMLFKGKRKQTTVPLVQQGETCVQDSPRIVSWLAMEFGPLKAMPATQQDEIIEVQQRFDAIGKAVARYLYLPGFAHDDLIKTIWTQFAKPWEAAMVRVFYPVIKPIFKIKLKINPKDVAKAEAKIDAEIQWLESQLKAGKKYLVGDRLTVADITAASLLAPLACPLEHPIYGSAEFREKMAGPAKKWADSPALQWVRDIYTQHRGKIWQKTPRS